MSDQAIEQKVSWKNFTKVFFVIAIATAAYAITSIYITTNLVQYSTLPSTMRLDIHNQAMNKNVQIDLPVSSVIPMDTADKKHRKTWIKTTGGDALYHQNPVFLEWTLLICMMISIAAGSFPVFSSHLAELKERFELKGRHILIAVLSAFLIITFLSLRNFNLAGFYPPPKIIDQFHILLKDGDILQQIVEATLFCVIPAISLIFLIPFCLPEIAKNALSISDLKAAVQKLDFLHQKLQGALQVLSIIVVFSVLTSIALGHSIRNTLTVTGFDLYPKEVSYVYGIFFSFFLCILYVPVYYFMKQVYNGIKEKALSPSDGTDQEQKDFYDNNFKEARFQNSAVDNMKLALTVFGPLLSGFLPGVLDAFR